MTKRAPFLIAGLVWLASAPATTAADLAGERVVMETPRFCRLVEPSPILNLPTLEHIEAEVEQRYFYSVDVAYNPQVAFNRSQAYTWAYETKLQCGKAIGYLGTRELDPESVSKCDCYYRRMLGYLR